MGNGREKFLQSPGEALEAITDGSVVGIGGSITAGHPMALIAELIRRDVRELTLVAPTAGLDVDLLIATNRVRKLVTSYVGVEGLAPVGPMFRAAAESGSLELMELDEAHCVAGLRAAAQGLPFLPWRGGVGTSLPDVNPALKEFADPIRGETLLAVPALELDVALIYGEEADPFGNLQTPGTSHMDPLLAAAADLVIAQVDRVVSNARIRERPERTRFWSRTIVVEAPWGTHPYSGATIVADERHLREYARAAESTARGKWGGLHEYVERYVQAVPTHQEYLDAIGSDRIAELTFSQ